MKQIVGILAVLLFISFSAFAHDGAWVIDVTSWESQTLGHDDDDPWKGVATVTVTNTMLQDWGDFHFSIYEPLTYSVIFSDATYAFQMLDSSLNPYAGASYVISGSQKTVDFEFYGNPVSNGQTVTFKIYTDNTSNQHAWFGLMAYPTPVPEPATMALLGLGALAILRKK